MYLRLRYCDVNDTYYMQTHREDYARIKNELNRVNRRVKKLHDESGAEEKKRLLERRKDLIEKREAAVCYIEIAPQDIPEGARIRPMHRLPAHIYWLDAGAYKWLLEQLRQTVELQDEGDA